MGLGTDSTKQGSAPMDSLKRQLLLILKISGAWALGWTGLESHVHSATKLCDLDKWSALSVPWFVFLPVTPAS